MSMEITGGTEQPHDLVVDGSLADRTALRVFLTDTVHIETDFSNCVGCNIASICAAHVDCIGPVDPLDGPSAD